MLRTIALACLVLTATALLTVIGVYALLVIDGRRGAEHYYGR